MLNKSSKYFFTKGGLGYIPLDDALELFYFENLVYNEEDNDLIKDKLEYQKFMDYIDNIAEKYLNEKEKCIYNLVIHENKKTSDITQILNYNSWRTTQNSINRVFKILKLYYDYEKINKELLEYEINRNFSKFDKKIINLLNKRYTIQQINKKLGKKFHYTKTHSIIKNVLNRLADMGGVCKQYYDFLIEIRKFKDSCHFSKDDNFIIKDEKYE